MLRSKEKIETNCYKFKTKHGSFVTLQSQWFSFINPWTKEVEYIVSTNTVISWVYNDWSCFFTAYLTLNLFILNSHSRLIPFSHPMGRHDSSGSGRSGNKSGQSSKSSEGQFNYKLNRIFEDRQYFKFACFFFVFFLTFLLEDGKKSLPIIPGISTTPGTMIYAGSIGTQIANEMLDFNRYGLTAEQSRAAQLHSHCDYADRAMLYFMYSTWIIRKKPLKK